MSAVGSADSSTDMYTRELHGDGDSGKSAAVKHGDESYGITEVMGIKSTVKPW